jgi:DNA-binding NarL/FixJ family response regulator
MIVVAEVDTADDAVAAALSLRPELCLLELRLPGGGIGAVKQISQALPATKIAILTVSGAGADLIEAVGAGADGYLLKSANPERLPVAIGALFDGEAAIPRALTMHLLEGLRARRRLRALESDSARLTERELQVLEFLRDGLSTAEMARRLEVSPVTIRRHVSSGLKKVGAEDRAAAIALLAERPSTRHRPQAA